DYGARLLLTAVRIVATEDPPGAALVQRWHETECRRGVVERFVARQSPACQRPSKLRHIFLCIAAAYAKRMQFQDLARKVLVQALPIRLPPLRPATCRAIRANGPCLVQVKQHGRMAGHGEQKVLEPPQNIRPDGIGFEAPGHSDYQ